MNVRKMSRVFVFPYPNSILTLSLSHTHTHTHTHRQKSENKETGLRAHHTRVKETAPGCLLRVYYDGKNFETLLKEKKPGDLSMSWGGHLVCPLVWWVLVCASLHWVVKQMQNNERRVIHNHTVISLYKSSYIITLLLQGSAPPSAYQTHVCLACLFS